LPAFNLERRHRASRWASASDYGKGSLNSAMPFAQARLATASTDQEVTFMRHMPRLPILFAIVGLATAPAMADVTASLKGVGGSVTLVPAPKGVLIKVDASGLKPGWHAIHLHEKGDCSDAAFKMAGAHTHGATPAVHGLLNPAANDTGDLPNIYAAADGTAKAELFTTMVTLAGLQDADGSAIVIHANPDDFSTQPIGGAGDRVGCAVIK
jgi:Cu-Zn family superoxide dismutase